TEITATIANWSRWRRLWFNAAMADLLSGRGPAAIAGPAASSRGRIPMSIQMVLLPVFVLVGLTFALLLWMAGARRQALVGRETRIPDIALGQPNWPVRATQIG